MKKTVVDGVDCWSTVSEKENTFEEPSELDDGDLGSVIAAFESASLPKPELIVYEYWCGSYEGSGDMIILSGDKWYLTGLGHCSCYGPVDNFEPDECFESLEHLAASCSKEYWEQQKGVAEVLRKLGYLK